MKLVTKVIMVIGTLLALAVISQNASAYSDPSEAIDTLWVTIASALVFVMVPGLALFYGGMLRKQIMTSTLAQCMLAMALVYFIWAFVGYSLAFSGDIAGFIGNLDWAFLTMSYTDPNIYGEGGISDLLFQGMFAGVTACIIVGASAERVRFSVIMAFLALWSILVYAPMAHMVWGGGLLTEIFGQETLDWAGGTVVHICSGITGVAIVLVLGNISTRTVKDRPHNIPLMFLGAILIWFGWFGFNGGAGSMDEIGIILMNTLLASLAGMMTWTAIQMITVGRMSVTGACAGMIAGLVTITPACMYVEAYAAVIMAVMGAAICYFGIQFLKKKVPAVDDALDVFGLHGLGGIWGAIGTGIFATAALSGERGLIEGSISLLGAQIAAVAFTLIFCFAVSYAIIKVLSIFMRIRLTEEEEMIGADIIEHGESAYN